MDPEFLKRGYALCQSPWLVNEESFRFQMVQKGQNNVRLIKVFTKYFYQYFQIFSIFPYNKSLMKKCHSFRFKKRFYKEREKPFVQQSMRIEKLGKVGLCFTIGFFIKFSKNLIFFSRSFCSHDIYCFSQGVRSGIFAF